MKAKFLGTWKNKVGYLIIVAMLYCLSFIRIWSSHQNESFGHIALVALGIILTGLIVILGVWWSVE